MTAPVSASELDRKYNRLTSAASSSLCTHCGWCTDACHVYLATKDPQSTPVAKAESVRRAYKKSHDWLRRVFPAWTGARAFSEADIERWREMAFRDCTLCERCVVNCPMGVETPQLVAAARAELTSRGQAPEMLVMLADMAISKEEDAALYRDFFLDQVKELEKEVQNRLGDPAARIPVGQAGARILYVPLSGAHTIVPQAVLFNAAGASWTFSMFEASNYAVFLGDAAKAKRIAERIVNEAKRLKVEEIVLTECGHAYSALRWEAAKWFGGELPFRVRSILEVLDEYVRGGRLHLDPTRNTEPVTYHDSCNLGRKGGLFEEPRQVIGAVASDFREMVPNRTQSLCCGGGAGLVAVPEWTEARLKAGKPKADQIRSTGASIVVTSCDNCRHQIAEINEHYGLGVKVTSLSEMTANALVVETKNVQAVPAVA